MAPSSLLGLLALVAFFLLVARKANQVFCLSVRGGHALLVQGQLDDGLRHELLSVLAHAGVEDATLRAVREGGELRLLSQGPALDEHVAQRLRNVFGARGHREPVLQRRAHRNLGQRLGWTWLAWRLHERERHGLHRV